MSNAGRLTGVIGTALWAQSCAEASTTGGLSEFVRAPAGQSCMVGGLDRLRKVACRLGLENEFLCPTDQKGLIETNRYSGSSSRYHPPISDDLSHPSHRVTIDSDPDPLQPDQLCSTYGCPQCNVPVVKGESRCSACGTQLSWQGGIPSRNIELNLDFEEGAELNYGFDDR